MDEYFLKLAKEAGFTDDEIAQFQTLEASNPTPPSDYSQTPVSSINSPIPTPMQSVQQPPDMVSPFTDESEIVTTTPFSYSHPGVDKAPLDPAQDVPMTNPIGGVPFSGTVADPSGQYYAGFGNYYGTVGANPSELAQMSPEEKVRMQTVAQGIMAQNPSNEQANSELAGAFPGKNINFQAHLQDPVMADPQGIATGSAQLKMGSTGNSTGKHGHNQTIDEFGNPVDYETMMQVIRNRQYR